MQGVSRDINRESSINVDSKPNVTVIVPVYNVERYLEQCVSSILGQSYPVLEVLLVDDGSTDGSGELCNHLAAESAHVRVVHKENAGLGLARNTGLDNLRPETTHVMFVDSDDWLELGVVETFVQAVEETGADCVLGGFTKRDDDGNPQFEFRLKDAVWEGDELAQSFTPRVCGSSPETSDSIPMSAWSSMFRKTNIDDHALRFPSEREVISEDFVFKFKYLQTCRKVVTTSCIGYSYRTNLSSLTTSYRPDRFEACLYFYDYACRLVTGSAAEADCKLRLKKTLLIYMKTCISQEVTRVSGKRRREACGAMRKMVGDKRLLKVISEYPCARLGLAQRAFVELLKHSAVRILYAAAACRVF